MNTIDVYVIPADITEPIRQELWNRDSLGRDLQRQVGGYYECSGQEVAPDDERTFWFNEEGKLVGLPPNIRATPLVVRVVRSGRHHPHARGLPRRGRGSHWRTRRQR